jgi:hypothetical protein
VSGCCAQSGAPSTLTDRREDNRGEVAGVQPDDTSTLTDRAQDDGGEAAGAQTVAIVLLWTVPKMTASGAWGCRCAARCTLDDRRACNA